MPTADPSEPLPDNRTRPALVGLSKASAWVGRNRGFTALLLVGAGLRLLTLIAYPPIFWFVGDSFGYVSSAINVAPLPTHPAGYSLILLLLEPFHSLQVVAVAQHLAGLAMGALVYAVARRNGLGTRISCLAAAPILLDAYEIQVEHVLLAEVWFSLTLLGALVVALWHPGRRSWRAGAGIGLLLGLAVTIRTIGTPVAVVVLVALALRRIGRPALIAATLCAVAPVLGYMTWFDQVNGQFAMTDSTGAFLWARTAPFADCTRFQPPANEKWLCYPPRTAHPNSGIAVFIPDSPIQQPHPTADPFAPATDAQARDFAKRAILAQPLDYATAVLKDVGRAVDWRRPIWPSPGLIQQYRFPAHLYELRSSDPRWVVLFNREARAYANETAAVRIVRPWSGLLRRYQSLVFVRGLMLAAALAMAIAAAVRARRWTPPLLVPLVATVALMLFPIAVFSFDYRYLLPAIAPASLTAALAWPALRTPSPVQTEGAAAPRSHRRR